jgi:hypothetical protein
MVTEQQQPSKAELLDALRTSGQEAQAKLSGLPAEEFEQGRYENGWSGREILAHVASIEWTYPRLLDIAKQATPAAPNERPVEPSQPATRTMRGGVNDYNQRQVEKRAQASVAELLAEFEKNRAATIAAVEGTDEALLTAPIRSAGGIEGALARVIHTVAVEHVLAHVNDIVGTEHADGR